MTRYTGNRKYGIPRGRNPQNRRQVPSSVPNAFQAHGSLNQPFRCRGLTCHRFRLIAPAPHKSFLRHPCAAPVSRHIPAGRFSGLARLLVAKGCAGVAACLCLHTARPLRSLRADLLLSSQRPALLCGRSGGSLKVINVSKA